MASFFPASPLRVACHQFAESEIEALRSLIALLGSYLKHPWEVVDDPAADAALVLVNLDHPQPETPRTGARLVGCAIKPRLKSTRCIHRPLRAAEVLAVLSEAAVESRTTRHPADTDESAAWSYRLRAWPLEFAGWPQTYWRVMAAMTPRHAGIDEIAVRSGVAHGEIRELLDRLGRLGLVDSLMQRHAVARGHAASRNGWRHLASRVGQLLGLGR